jgi:addiction module HigA family antidote
VIQIDPFHPGVFLQELLEEQNISPRELAEHTGIHEGIIIDITMQLQGIDKETAIGFATYFGNSAEYWINLQESFDQANGKR